MRRSLAALIVAAGLGSLTAPGTARAQGVFEAGLGYALTTGTLSDYEDGGVDFTLLFGYSFNQRFTVSTRGALTLLRGKTIPDGLGGSVRMPDLNLWRLGIGLDVNVLQPGNRSQLLLQGFVGLGVLATPTDVECGVFCWTVPGTSQTNFSVGAGAEYLYSINRNVAVGVGASYLWIFGVDVVGVAGSGSRTLGSVPVAAFMRVSE